MRLDALREDTQRPMERGEPSRAVEVLSKVIEASHRDNGASHTQPRHYPRLYFDRRSERLSK